MWSILDETIPLDVQTSGTYNWETYNWDSTVDPSYIRNGRLTKILCPKTSKVTVSDIFERSHISRRDVYGVAIRSRFNKKLFWRKQITCTPCASSLVVGWSRLVSVNLVDVDVAPTRRTLRSVHFVSGSQYSTRACHQVRFFLEVRLMAPWLACWPPFTYC